MPNRPAELVFLDVEAIGLDPAAPVWEFAAHRRHHSGRSSEAAFTIKHNPNGWLDELPPQLRLDYADRYDPDTAIPQASAAHQIDAITRGAHIVGASPSFDTERLSKLLRRNGIEPGWHYHLIDVGCLILGYLAARGQNTAAPWKFDDLSRAIGIDPGYYPRHTASGDVAWIRDQFDRIAPLELRRSEPTR